MIEWNGNVHPAASAFPWLEPDDLDQLAADIAHRGLIEPGWLMPDGTLLDGRNRAKACEQVGAVMRWRVYEGDDPIGHVISLNVARRHLSTGQRAFVALEAEKLYAEESRQRMAEAAAAQQERARREREAEEPMIERQGLADLPNPLPPITPARDKAAATAGTSGRAVGQAKRIAENAPDLAEKVIEGRLALDAAEKQLKRRQAQQAEQEAREATLESYAVDASGDRWRLMAGDFRTRLAELPAGCVDLIVTDPPYPTESLPLYEELAKIANHVLTDDGICVVLTGQISLDRVFELLGRHLNYGWTYVQPLPGASSRIMGRHIMQSWKPWVAFTKRQWPSGRIDWHPDMLDPSYRAKDQYRWQQDPSPAKLLIDALCPPGGTVCDPFTGTGSYGRAALEMDRSFIGCELDSDRFTTARDRFGG